MLQLKFGILCLTRRILEMDLLLGLTLGAVKTRKKVFLLLSKWSY